MNFTDRMERVKEDILTRLKPYALREDTHTCPLDAASVGICADDVIKKDPFTNEFRENPDAPYVINLANAIVRSWKEVPVVIFRNEAIVGITRPEYTVHEHFSWGIQGAESVFDDHDINRDEAEKLFRRMSPFTWDHVTNEGIRLLGERRYEALCNDNMFSAGGYQGHTVPDYGTLLCNGLDGMLKLTDKWAGVNARGNDTCDLYEACRIIIRGMSEWLTMYAAEAERLAASETDAVQKRFYAEIAENCAYVAHNKPKTLYQAVQLVWTLSLWDWVDCMGRMDQYLYGFYERAVRDGDVISPEESITSIIFKIWENGSHNVTLSGMLENGSDATNELTYLMLQILRSIHDTHPRMTVRLHKNSPPELLDLVISLWSEGMSDPTVVSDETVIPGLIKIGVDPKDARNYTVLGCQEIEIPGMSNTGCEDGIFNIAKVLEYAFHNGKSTSDPDVQVGPATGEFTDFKTFDEFYTAFRIQLEYFTKIFCTLCNKGQEIRAANFAKLVKTPFTAGCLEKGMPHDAGGPVYNYGVVETAGLAAVSDSLTAVKKLVFDEQRISSETLMAAIDADFDGYEKERLMLLNKSPKFGNDDDEADSMAVKVLNTFWDEIAKYRSVRGGVFTGACSLLYSGIYYGKHTGALPDGRFKGEPLGNSIGPRPGADKSGVTAMLNSVQKLPLQKGVGGTTLNVVLTTKMLSTPALRKKTAAVIRSYIVNGGQMAQITTANLEDLADAQCHPERHGDLIVRIGGFSIQFVQLDKEAQDEIMSRYS